MIPQIEGYQHPVDILKETEHFYLISGSYIKQGLTNSTSYHRKYAIIDKKTLKEWFGVRQTSFDLEWIIAIMERKEERTR